MWHGDVLKAFQMLSFNLSTCMSHQNQSDTLDMLLDRRRSHPHVAHWPPSQSPMKRLFERERESGTVEDHHALRTVTTSHSAPVLFPAAVLHLKGGITVTTLQTQKGDVICQKLEKAKLGFKLRSLISKPLAYEEPTTR